jgi:hypothetical protein
LDGDRSGLTARVFLENTMSVDKYGAPPPPRKGDKLFRGDLNDWMNNACIRDGDEYAYREGYRRGARVLVRAVEETQSDQDFLVYPIIFLYRHHIELALKRVIKRAPYLIERPLTEAENDHLVNHRLDSLWKDLKPMAKAISKAAGWNELPSEDVEGIDDYIRQLCEVDPRSYSLRYAHSKKGAPSLPEGLTHINLRHFGELMERLANYLDGLDAGTSELVDRKQEMDAEMRDQMGEYYDDYREEYYADDY